MSEKVVEPPQARWICIFIITTLQGCRWQLCSSNTELWVDMMCVMLSWNILSRFRSILLVINNDMVKMATFGFILKFVSEITLSSLVICIIF